MTAKPTDEDHSVPETPIQDDFIQIDLPPESLDILAICYMDANFSEATRKLFKFHIQQGDSFRDALYYAVINETANVALREYMDNNPLKPKEEQNDHFTNDE